MGERRHFLLVAAAIAFFSLAVPAAWNRYLQALGPLDLTETGRGSAVVLDRHGRLLRAFTMTDGRWRLPVRASRHRSTLGRNPSRL